ncbi:LamG-like jellyroll fold domain-containing protein [Streptomyces sp. RKAG293]|uniref:LamG-like jellyroll fold domain-containing protein n=1 Tax=Streptomyces sp. RKAG293 TaxID=2893403 RepID=UPI0020335A51|nr:LamG-like jellyroll fold domain-containing protein [Streptomyces sp. RKAG293]MCM2417102.1 carbohydrate binding domain-containing protein [Streptomyces sp. RKAG293]
MPFTRSHRPGRHLRQRLRTAAALAASAALLTVGFVPLAATPAAAATALAGHWALDEATGSTAADDSGGAHPGTLAAGASHAAGQVGAGSVATNGTGTGTIDLGAPIVDTSGSFSVSAWVKLDNTDGYQTAVSIDGADVSGFYLGLRGDTGTFAFARLPSDTVGTAAVAASGDSPAAGSWYHLTGVQDTAAGTLSLYVNGALQTAVPYTTPWKATGHAFAGRGKYAGNPVDHLDGGVDDLRFYTGALAASEVTALDQPAHWAFDAGTGTSAADSSGHGHPLTLGATAAWTTGKAGAYALRSNGTAASSATTGAAATDTSQSFSVSAWVRLNSLTGYQTFARLDGTSVSGCYLQLRGDTGKFAFTRLASDSSTATVRHADATAAPTAGTWYHLTGVSDNASGRLRLYVNGILQSTVAYTTPWKAAAGTAVGRGRFNGNPVDFADAAIDDVVIYDHPVTAPELETLLGQGNGTLSVNAATAAHALPSDFSGLMTEDINHSGEGGLYGELLQNRSLMATSSSPTSWSAVSSTGGSASIALDTANPLNSALTRSLKVSLTGASPGNRAGVANSGFWGVPVKPSTTYTASLYAKAAPGFTGPLKLSLESTGGTAYATATIPAPTTAWKKYTVRLTTTAGAPTGSANRFVLSSESAAGATLWLSNVSLFPPTYNNRPNGLRVDLMEKMKALKPSFIRLPGGNYLEGNTVAERFDWKKTLGPTETRPGHQDPWGYWSTDGLGLLEYLEWCEDLGARPVLGVYAGYSLQHDVVPLDQLSPYVQDALDEIQYITGDVTTKWGARRAADGHPAPFSLQYVEVGNEDWFDTTGSYDGANGRYAQFHDAIRAAYPALKLIATTAVSARTPDVVDLHNYRSPGWFNVNANAYDTYSRSGPKVFEGEWASQAGRPTPTLAGAIGDASWLTNLQRNSDVVAMEAYAPLLANVNSVQWNTNLIAFDASTSYNSPGAYVQQMMAAAHGDQILTASYSGTSTVNQVVSRSSRTGKYYITVVNPGGNPQSITVRLTGAGAAVPTTGTAVTLTSAHLSDTNTLTDPRHIVPVTTAVTGLGASFTRTFPASSVTQLTIG